MSPLPVSLYNGGLQSPSFRSSQHKKIIREHDFILQKHDKAGVAVEETAEGLSSNMKKLEGVVKQLTNKWSTTATQLGDNVMKTVTDLEERFGMQIEALSATQKNDLFELKSSINEQLGSVQERLAESQSSAEEEERKQEVSLMVHDQLKEAEERILSKQEVSAASREAMI